MDFFEVAEKRRSIRRFKPEVFPEELVRKALECAILAPNSSNTQTWDFHWVKTPDLKQKLVEACLSQSAAKTASHLVVVTADPKNWRRSQKPLSDYVKSVNAPTQVVQYYEKLIPFMYSWGPFNILAPFKFLLGFCVGLFRPMMRGPNSRGDQQLVSIKSAALASENFVLAITALGGASCMMEGFDEVRVSRMLKLSWSSRVVMVIGVGFEAERGTWGPRFRLPLESVLHER